LPKYQNSSIGKSLIEKVQNAAKKLKKKKLLVSTSNDDLPALAFYQSIGFQIYEVKPNVIAEKTRCNIERSKWASNKRRVKTSKILS